MYKWYADAQICYAYISDFVHNGPGKLPDGIQFQLPPPPADSDKAVEYWATRAFANSKWFTRGWTLQELIAPEKLHFFDVQWNLIGYRRELTRTISDITNIDIAVLDQTKDVASISVGKKMSWASTRQTTRVEDQAVSPPDHYRTQEVLSSLYVILFSTLCSASSTSICQCSTAKGRKRSHVFKKR